MKGTSEIWFDFASGDNIFRSLGEDANFDLTIGRFNQY
jgi:hypothetical protein